MASPERKTSLEFNVRPDLGDYYRFAWWIFRRTWPFKTMVRSWVVFAGIQTARVVAVELTLVHALLTVSVFALVTAAFLALLVRFAIARPSAKYWALREPLHYEVSADGVSASSLSLSGQQAWSVFRRAVETNLDFYLLANPWIALIIPKRSFASPSEVQAFRDIVQQNMPVDACRLRPRERLPSPPGGPASA